MIISVSFIYPTLGIEKSTYNQHEYAMKDKRDVSGLDENGNLVSHLPIIIIKNNGKEFPGRERTDKSKLVCEFSVIDNDKDMNYSNKKPDYDGFVSISIRGNSSRYLEKKQYSIKTVDENGNADNIELLGMPADSSWALNGSFIDKSLIRNYIMNNISGEIMDYSPRSRLCEVMTTDADGNCRYEGVYTLMEKPKVSKSRLNLNVYDPKYSQTSYLIQMNLNINSFKFSHIKPDSIAAFAFDLEYPGIDVISKESIDYIQNDIYTFEKVLYDSLNNSDFRKVNKYFDIDSFVDYYIINEFFQNYDAGSFSTFFYKDLGGKVNIGPVWDFDGAMNNFEKEISVESMRLNETIFFHYMRQNPYFVRKSVSRYKSLRKTVLSDEYLLNYIDSSAEYLGSAADRNAQRWYGGDTSLFEKDIEKMKKFVVERGAWLDNNFEKMSTITN